MPQNFAADSFHTKKLCSRLSSSEMRLFIRYTRLRRRKSICIPNFDEIPQSTAEIKLLPVSDDGWPPYWNFTSNFHSELQCMCKLSACRGASACEISS